EVVGKHRTGKLTARRSVYNHFSPHKQKCRAALTERHYPSRALFLLHEFFDKFRQTLPVAPPLGSIAIK
ncbi:hypothetical protein, partial [Caballeronia sp. INML1]|uniref:hypothetical protein n=1 Tax=Caballeronia sp. INML1 TaxID=2921760 RepID=UPI002027E39D